MYMCPDCGCEYLELVYEKVTISRRGRYIPGAMIFEVEKEIKIEELGELAEIKCTNPDCRYAGVILEFNTEPEEE